MATIISAPRLLVGSAIRGPGGVVVEGGLIVDLLDRRPAPGRGHIALDAGILAPGLVDLQVNGCLGVDLLTATPAQWHEVATALPRFGVTSFQPTFVTSPGDVVESALHRLAGVRSSWRSTAARLLGVHLEGPFLSRARTGAHDPALLGSPSPAAVDLLLRLAADTGLVTTVTIAPELPDALAAITRLTAAGVVVSIGHSDALAGQVSAAVRAGARMVTHVFNAQRGPTAREPGVAGQALVEPELTVGLIADFAHVSPAICTLVLNAAPGRVALVSDAVAAAGMPPGDYTLGGRRIRLVRAGDVARTDDGTIAGATTLLDQAVRNVAGAGHDLGRTLAAAATVPANALGRRDLGRLEAGAKADLVWWEDGLRVRRSWVGGEQVHAASPPQEAR